MEIPVFMDCTALASEKSKPSLIRTYTAEEVASAYRKLDPAEGEAINRHRREWLDGRGAAYEAKRKAAKLRATPKWADLDAIASIYKQCSKVSRRTGIVHHVDHEIPLQGRSVCGLHVANNLRIISGSENVKKGRSFKP